MAGSVAPSGSRPAAWIAGLAFVLAFAAGGAQAQDLLHSDRELTIAANPAGGCTAIIIPTAATGGDQAPRIAIDTYGKSAANALGLFIADPGAFEDVTLVQDNQREPLTPVERAEVDAAKGSALGAALASGRLFFVTARRGGQYVSSRYEGTDLDRTLARLGETCGFGAVAEVRRQQQGQGGDGIEASLDRAALTHVRWVLNRKYGGREEPRPSEGLLPEERDYLKRYNEEQGLPASTSLTDDTARLLMAERFQPIDEPPYSGLTLHQPFVNWAIYVAGRKPKTCMLVTRMANASEESFWQVPYMSYTTKSSDRNGVMVHDLVSPNPFDPDQEVFMTLDGRRIDLAVVGGHVTPRPLKRKGEFSPDVVKYTRNTGNLAITGTSRVTGNQLTIGFSAAGFGNGFKEFMFACDRERGLRAWRGPWVEGN